MLPATEQLALVANSYAAATGVSISTLSTKLFNGGGRLGSIASGGDLNTRSFERAMEWFSDNWPADLHWPSGVARPMLTERVAS